MKPRLHAVFLSGVVAMSVLSNPSGAQQPREPLYRESMRPLFHITARYWDNYQLHPPNHEEGWLNDMNGLVYNAGEYHFFAQRWWSAWLHAVSTDLIHWKELRPAFGKGGTFGGTQSGGCVVDHHNSSGLGDGTEPPMLAFWSSTDNLNQCMSYSRDRGRTWTKYEKNPVLTHAFRDPNVFRYEPGRKWIMILYGPADTRGKVIPAYGFNGESNDAHHLRPFEVGDWQFTVVTVGRDGTVTATDTDGMSRAMVDSNIQNVGTDACTIGGKAGTGEFLNGEIAEILVFDRTVTADRAEALVNALRSKWGPQAPGRQPGVIPTEGLVLRLDAAGAEAGADGRVTRWPDASGRGNDASQTDPQRRPTLVPQALNGKPAVAFSENRFLASPAVLPEGCDELTVAAVWRRTRAEGSEVIWEQNTRQLQRGRRAALLTTCRPADENCYLLFESENLLEWKKLDTAIADSFECPDMFCLPVDGDVNRTKWVVVDGNGDYIIGAFDGNRFTPETPKRKGDHGRNFYATMTFENMPATDPRRIQMAWMRGWDDYPKDMPFNQQASFPCELTLRTIDGELVICRQPIREIAKLYGDTLELTGQTLAPGENPLAKIDGEAFDVALILDTRRSTCDSVTLRLRGNTVRYDLATQTLHSHGTEVRLVPRDGVVDLRILVDRLSLETFGNGGEVSITNIAYKQEGTPHLAIEAAGGPAFVSALTVRTLGSIWE